MVQSRFTGSGISHCESEDNGAVGRAVDELIRLMQGQTATLLLGRPFLLTGRLQGGVDILKK